MEAEHKVFRQTEAGWVVHISKGAQLPGVYMNFTLAEKAYKNYIGQSLAAKAEKKKGK